MGLIIWKDPNGKERIIQADIVADLSDDRQTEVTEHAIENGSAISDHVRQTPDTLTVTLKQSQTPIKADEPFKSVRLEQVPIEVRESLFQPGGFLAITRAAGAALDAGVSLLTGSNSGSPTSVLALNTQSGIDRIAEIHDALISLRQAATTAELQFLNRRYTNMILRSLSYTRSGSAQVGVFGLTFRQIATVSSATTELPDPVSLRMKEQQSKGSKPGKTATKTDEEIRSEQSSLLLRLVS